MPIPGRRPSLMKVRFDSCVESEDEELDAGEGTPRLYSEKPAPRLSTRYVFPGTNDSNTGKTEEGDQTLKLEVGEIPSVYILTIFDLTSDDRASREKTWLPL